MRIRRRECFGVDVSGCGLGVLPIGGHAVSSAAVAARNRAEQGQALIVGIGSLYFFAVVDAARSGLRLSGARDERGYENGGHNGSQGLYPLRLAPVFFATSATILPAAASISASVRVFSRGCKVTEMATDFMPSGMPLPS